MPSNKAPPVIDFSDYLSGDKKRMQHCADQIHEACTTQGFFQIVNHPSPLSLQKEMFKIAKEFFDLPLEEKMKLDKAKVSLQEDGQVMHGQMIEANTKPDLKEGYYVSRDLPLDHPQVVASKFAHGPNVWPESLGEHFQETCMDYLNQIMELIEEVMRAIALSLGYDTDYFNEFLTDPMCFCKILHYPPQADDAHPLQRGIGAHRDFGVITLLLQGDVPGLEVWDDEAKDWYPAPPVEGAYVVNMGNLFEQWTNDVYISNVHRVINHSGGDRYSIPFNYNGNPDFVIKCIEKCRARAEEEKHAPVSVEDYVRQKYKDVYARAGIYSVAEKAH
ncbi:MFS transporter [Xylariales sp. AK1849]|nr:MFS transporter [Xylariales sp. AK1849]